MRRCQESRRLLARWPIAGPRDWTDRVSAPQTEAEVDAVRRALRRSSPFGSSEWQRTTAQRLGVQTTLRRVPARGIRVSNMDYITRGEARRDIVGLGLPQIVLDVFDEKPLPYNLDIQFRFPYTILSLGPEGQAAYGEGRITPIWTGRGDYTIVAYHHAPARSGFFRFGIETPDDERQPIGMSWQQVLVKEFKFLWETEAPDDTLREVAGWFGFNYIEPLIADLSVAKLDSTEKDAIWYSSFLKRVGG